jgi:hypothetical protein
MPGTMGRATLWAFGMSDDVWARHANPWSVWTRFTVLPLVILALWSRVWIGWPWALLLTALCVLWAWLNPRVFPPPRSLDNWASKAVLGERIWLARYDTPIPAHHARIAAILSSAAALGLPFLIWGVWMLDPWPTFLGLLIVYSAKLWFIDRMVWLYEETSKGENGQ